MFDMQSMLADMLKKALPPEVLAMLTEEKIKEVGEKANAFVADIRGSLDFIKAQNETSHALLVALQERIEAIENDNRNSTSRSGGSRGRKPSVSSGGVAGDDGNGNGTE